MRATISAQNFDLLGSLSFTPLASSSAGEVSRRVTRVATLDAGVAVNDRGYSDGDRDLSYSWKPVSREQDATAQRLVRLHPRVTVSNAEGVFLCAPRSFEPGSEENRILLLVIQRLSEV